MTTEFHRLTAELDKTKQQKDLTAKEKAEKIAAITADIDAIGGRNAYQDAR